MLALYREGTGEERRFKPESTPLPAAIFPATPETPEILKVSWPSSAGKAYVIETTPSLDIPWTTFSFELGVDEATRRSIVVVPSTKFFRVSEASTFQIDTSVNWCVDFPNLSSNEVQECNATWVFDDEVTNSVSSGGMLSPLSRTYESPGLKSAQVTVERAGDIVKSDSWAIMVTNVNLIANGGFEQSSNSLPLKWFKGGYGTNTRSHTYPVPGVNGSSRAARVDITNNTYGDVKWYNEPVPVTGNSTYEISLYYHSTSPLNLTAETRLTNNSLTYPWLTTEPASVSWRKVVIQFVTHPNAKTITFFPAVTNGSLVIDEASLTKVSGQPVTPRGRVSLRFDDGHRDTTITTSNILRGPGYKGSYYIVTDRVGRSGIVTAQDVVNLDKVGHEVGGHTLTHADLTTLSLATAEREINLCRDALLSWGVRSVTTFAYPFGSYNATVRQLTKEAGYAAACGTGSGLNDKATLDPYALKGTSIRSSMTVDNVKAMIDQALLENKWLILTFHHVDSTVSEYSVTPAYFQQVVNYLVSKNAQVVTVREGHKLLTAP